MKKLLLTIASTLALATTAQAERAKVYPVTLTEQNTLTMDTYFNSKSVSKVVQKAQELDSALDSGEPLYLVLDTGGGSISAGLELVENLRTLNRPVRTITLFAASMGFHTVQGLGARLIQRDGTLMSHKATGFFYGEFPGQLDSRYAYWLRRVQKMDRRVVARTDGVHNMDSYRALIENEYWCDGVDCLKQGFADVLTKAKCDKTLSGTKEETRKFFFFGKAIELKLVKSKCPLVTGLLDYSIQIDGVNPFTENGYYLDMKEHQVEELRNKITEIINSYNKRTVKKSY